MFPSDSSYYAGTAVFVVLASAYGLGRGAFGKDLGQSATTGLGLLFFATLSWVAVAGLVLVIVLHTAGLYLGKAKS